MKTRLDWDCGDEVLRRLRRASHEKRRRVISSEVLAALQYHCATEDVDHAVVFMDNAELVIDFNLPDCERRFDLRRIVEEEIEARGGIDEEVAMMEKLFEDLARLCREARLENRPAAGEPAGASPGSGLPGPGEPLSEKEGRCA